MHTDEVALVSSTSSRRNDRIVQQPSQRFKRWETTKAPSTSSKLRSEHLSKGSSSGAPEEAASGAARKENRSEPCAEGRFVPRRVNREGSTAAGPNGGRT